MFRFMIMALLLLFTSTSYSTIDVAVYTPEGVVFASDGRVANKEHKIILTESYEKIVLITKLVMAQIQGNAYTENKNLKAKIQDFKQQFDISDSSNLSVDSIAGLFVNYCEQLKKQNIQFGDFLIMFAGLDSSGAIKYCKYKPTVTSKPQWLSYGLYYYGITNIPDRLIKGIDSELEIALYTYLEVLADSINCDLSPIKLSDIINVSINKTDLSQKINQLSCRWSMKDAINYAYTLVKTTVIFDQMISGNYMFESDMPPKTGGDILICIVTREGVRWIIPPDYLPSWREDFDN